MAGDDNKLNVNLSSKALEQGLEVAKGFLDKLLIPVVSEIGELLADPIKAYRLKRQIDLLAKTQAYAEKNGIQIKPVALKVLVPLLEGVSLEEEEELVVKWRNLLINYIDSAQVRLVTVYPSILGQLSSYEVVALTRKANPLNPELSGRKVVELTKAEVGNLERLGLIKKGLERKGNIMVNFFYSGVPRGYAMTEFGREFVRAVSEAARSAE